VSAPEITVVVPLYRTAETVPELHARLAAALAGRTFELVLVDDACPAGSGAAAAARAATDERVRLLSLPRNRGQHAAVLAGLAEARGAWVVAIDGDLQDPPEAVPVLLDTARDLNVPVVFAGRRGRYQSRMRLLTSRAYKHTLAALTGVPSDAGLFVALERPVVEELLRMDGPRRPSVVAMIGCTGAPTRSIPVERAPRASGESSYGAWGRLTLGWRAVVWVIAWRLGRRRGGRTQWAR